MPTQALGLKGVILVGGPQKGTRFRPLSLDYNCPKPLFPIAGTPLIEHHIVQLCQLKSLSDIYLMGFYPADQFSEFIQEAKQKYRVNIKYLEENIFNSKSNGSSPKSNGHSSMGLGTAGGLLYHKEELLKGNPSAIFVLNADVCGDLSVDEMAKVFVEKPAIKCLILTTEATRDQSINFGCVVIDHSGKVLHYVDKPTTFVSTHISCGIYLFRTSMFDEIERARNGTPQIWFETDIFPQMSSSSTLYAFHTTRWWSQTKTPAATLYANRHYLRLYRERCTEKLCKGGAEIEGDVVVYPTAQIHSTAKLGPNVSIGAGAKIGAGVRVKESIVLPECVLEDHSCVLYSIVGWRSVVGPWARVEGTPITPNPNIPFAKLDNKPLFNADGRLNPSLTILGSDVHVQREQVILNSVVLPYKDLTASYKNQIIL